ncbi:Ig-like domain-containing protein [Sporolactobacillus sp. STSJ-5]|uniref:Ig-like domain-containing protein n=1 Tax=Sporolactobacillus sp. STSJ-5 TaxID=2965076 RepID=UPI00210384D2|nr:Ig-like domain-containing protein [Sporolactobacillus sp. STSJ-5]
MKSLYLSVVILFGCLFISNHVFAFDDTKASEETKTSIGEIENPVSNANVSGDINITGWLLDQEDINKIEVIIDKTVVGNATYGLQREDIKEIHPEFNNSYSGYEYKLDSTQFTNGLHSLEIKGLTVSGKVDQLETNIVINNEIKKQNSLESSTSNEQNEDPNDNTNIDLNRSLSTQNRSVKGYLEKPINEEVVSKDINLQGWYLDPSEVASVDIEVDGNRAGSANIGLQRIDVAQIYPEYQNNNSGFQYTLNTRVYKNGFHTLRIVETGKNGNTNIISQRINVQNLPAMGYVETPKDEEGIRSDYNIRGWFLDGSGVQKIEAFIDGWYAGEAFYGIKRSDVQNVFNKYDNENSGFQYTINTRRYKNGEHTLTLKEYSNNGQTTEVNKNINIQNLPSIGNVEKPQNQEQISDNANIKGWYLDGSGVKKIEAYLDGWYAGEAMYGIERTDVNNVFREYENKNSGFQYTLNTKLYTNGEHTITFKETSNNGGTSAINKTIKIQNLPSIGYIEEPQKDGQIQGTTILKGWYLTGSGIKKIEAYIDGWYAGEAFYGAERDDVLNAYPEYKNKYSGFQYLLDTSHYMNGIHSITFVETSQNGETSKISSEVNINNPPAIGVIETPNTNQIVQGIVKLSGWYLDGSPISKIEVIADGVSMGEAKYGFQRGDVESVYPMYNTWNSGYEYYLDTSSLSAGAHTLTVKEIAVNGHTDSQSITIYVSKFENGALKKGIDVSHYQYDNNKPSIDFNAVRNSGVSFVIAKATEGSEAGSAMIDNTFQTTINNANAAGLQTHAYHMFRGVSESDAREEAQWFIKNLRNLPVNGYLFVDVEYKWLDGDATKLTSYVNAFLDELYNAGYHNLGIYTNYYYMKDRLIESNLRPGVLKWIARYNDTLGRDADIWQNTSSGSVPGISGDVDIDYSYSTAF